MAYCLLETTAESLHDPKTAWLACILWISFNRVTELVVPVDIPSGVKLDIVRLRGLCQAVKRLIIHFDCSEKDQERPWKPWFHTVKVTEVDLRICKKCSLSLKARDSNGAEEGGGVYQSGTRGGAAVVVSLTSWLTGGLLMFKTTSGRVGERSM